MKKFKLKNDETLMVRKCPVCKGTAVMCDVVTEIERISPTKIRHHGRSYWGCVCGYSEDVEGQPIEHDVYFIRKCKCGGVQSWHKDDEQWVCDSCKESFKKGKNITFYSPPLKRFVESVEHPIRQSEFPWSAKPYTASYIDTHHEDRPIMVAVPGIIQGATIHEAIQLRGALKKAIQAWTLEECKRSDERTKDLG